jgi:hypothetical protein
MAANERGSIEDASALAAAAAAPNAKRRRSDASV